MTMRTFARIAAAFAFLAAAFGYSAQSQAGFSLAGLFQTQPKIVATVSIADQRMVLDVTKNGVTQTYVFKVSTGKAGYETPFGSFKPTWLDIDHVSKTYDNAPMPYSVFFVGGYAIHATDAVSRLGQPASHGCVRLAPEHAAFFYDLVQSYGKSNTKIVITA
jgi:lipoprotein-anchoring transpeptidase ErfK/SrfK